MQERSEASQSAVHEAARLQGVLAAREREVVRLQERLRQSEEAEKQLLADHSTAQTRAAELEAEAEHLRKQVLQIDTLRREFAEERATFDMQVSAMQEQYDSEARDQQQEIIRLKSDKADAMSDVKRLKQQLSDKDSLLRTKEVELAAIRSNADRDAEVCENAQRRGKSVQIHAVQWVVLDEPRT
jgi:predicted  nucleic acid-binding Zn-ribbon protein